MPAERAGRRRLTARLLFLACTLAWPLLSLLTAPVGGEERTVSLLGHQYAYEPERIELNRGDRLTLSLAALDAVHGLYMEGHDLEAVAYPGRTDFKARKPSEGFQYSTVEEVSFTASRPGKYRYRCSVTCGSLHPFMLGELIVKPNLPFQAAVGAALGMLLALLYLLGGGSLRREQVAASGWRVDLLKRFPSLGRVLRSRWFPMLLTVPTLACFTLFLIAGYFGTPIGNRNVIITLVWIFWWFLLITTFVPLMGRAWCMICPYPFLGEWIQRRSLLAPPGRRRGRENPHPGGGRRRWPPFLSNTWLQAVIYLTLCSFSALLLTRPIVSALVLSLLALGATVVHLLYRERSFCSYLCPLNGWMSLYSMGSALEVRSRKGAGACAACTSKTCAEGSARSWPCPWFQDPGTMERNNYCGLCMECVKGCGNMTVRVRPFFADTRIETLGESWMAFIMVTLVVFYSAIMQGPWGTLKEWVNFSESGNWQGFLLYLVLVWGSAMLLVPALWGGFTWAGRRLSGLGGVSFREGFKRTSYMLVPLGLMTWIGFTLPLMQVSATHVISSLSDPFGWGWDLFGTASMPWQPFFPETIPYIQSLFVLLGLSFCLKRGVAVLLELYPAAAAPALVRAFLPQALFCTGISILFLRLFAG